jgi:hypothetical protein
MYKQVIKDDGCIHDHFSIGKRFIVKILYDGILQE